MNCEHLNTKTIVMDSGPHYAKIVCADCEKFMGWSKKPETIERIKENGRKIDFLTSNPMLKLTNWERQFIGSLATHPNKLSPKQQETLDKIATSHGI